MSIEADGGACDNVYNQTNDCNTNPCPISNLYLVVLLLMTELKLLLKIVHGTRGKLGLPVVYLVVMELRQGFERKTLLKLIMVRATIFTMTPDHATSPVAQPVHLSNFHLDYV